MRGTTDGLVIRETAVGESDKLITVLTRDKGKILISAKGVRSQKSKNTALCRPFVFANFEYYEKGGRYWLSSGSINDSFFGLNADVESLALASYILDITNEISGENSPDDTLLRTVLNTLFAIEKKIRPLEQIKGSFEFFAAAHSGFSPDLCQCEKCGQAKAEAFYLDVMNGSLICSACLSSKKLPLTEEITEYDRFATKNILIPISLDVIKAILYVTSAEPKRIFSFALSKDEAINEFSHVGEIYLQNHLERGFESLEFYKMVTKPVTDKKQN
ncbi:MAG: DNA repair protein RecO [Clostridia bacterium]|nr:DNA repair protein RecO [Clostridia bacterium]